MNECTFFIQILIIVSFARVSLRMGKSALIAWISVQALLANLFVLKQISLFGFEVTASDGYAVGSLIGLNLLQEHFGKQESQKAALVCFFLMLFFVFCSQLHLLYVPSQHDSTHSAFQTILSLTPRLFFSSMGVFFLVQQFDIRFFAFLKTGFPSLSFPIRSAICLVFSQAMDTLLFSYFGLYGVVASLGDIILVSLAIKLLVILFATPIVKWAKS